MFSLNNKDRMLDKRELKYKAECALADSLDVLPVLVSLPVKDKAERVYCYCYLKGKNAMFVAFYTVGEEAFLFSDELSKAELMDFNMAVMSQLVYLKSQYEDCPELMPAELFLDFDPVKRDVNALAGMEAFSDPNDITIRSLTWYKEHGGKLKRSAALAMKMGRFKAQAEAARNPDANAVKLDRAALDISRKYIAGEIDDPALSAPETGWDAVRAEMFKAYNSESLPMSFESDDGKSWVDIYDSKNCWHYVSCGLSSMGHTAEEESLGAEYTLSLKRKADQDEDDIQIFALLNMLRVALSKAQSEKVLLADYDYIPAEQAGLVAVPEKKLNTVNAAGGSIEFRKLVYITAEELAALQAGSIDAESLCRKIGSDISDYSRKSVI